MFINGLRGIFTSSRGIRQVCSLSPYLYVILNNVLSKPLNRAPDDKRFSFHPTCADVKLSHFSFADNILVFNDGTLESLSDLLEVLEEFSRMSGLQINIAKPSLEHYHQESLTKRLSIKKQIK